MRQSDRSGEEPFDHDRLVLLDPVVRQRPVARPGEGDPGHRRGCDHSLKELASIHEQRIERGVLM
jgi:hypothetical protein